MPVLQQADHGHTFSRQSLLNRYSTFAWVYENVCVPFMYRKR